MRRPLITLIFTSVTHLTKAFVITSKTLIPKYLSSLPTQIPVGGLVKILDMFIISVLNYSVC